MFFIYHGKGHTVKNMSSTVETLKPILLFLRQQKTQVNNSFVFCLKQTLLFEENVHDLNKFFNFVCRGVQEVPKL